MKQRIRKHKTSFLHWFHKTDAVHVVAYAFTVAIVLFLGWFTAWAFVVAVPSVNSFENRRVAESTKIFDRTGDVLLYDVHGTMRRTAVPLEEISPYIRNATIAIEDSSFYQHNGFRPTSFARAVLVNLHIIPGIVGQGGSTLTQQVVKNTLLTQEKTIIRKMKEIVLSLKLETVLEKDQILEIYLNETPYGGTMYGVEEASETFFGKDAKDVTLAEAAYLAALPQAPTRYSPYGNNKDLLENRKNLVLSRMLQLGFIGSEEYDAALAEEVVFRDEQSAGIKAPHFVFYVREYLEEKYGADVVAQGGLRVVTTLDWDLQQKAEEIIARRAPDLEANFNASNTGLVAVDPKTGHILTMVGSRNYFDEEIDGMVNIATAKRQPGSSFKPFVYATALAKGYTPETVLFDLKTQFSTACRPDNFSKEAPCFSPDNFDNTFKGPMTLRAALAQSVNVVAVKTLYLAGIPDSIETAERMGITTLADAARYGLTLVLGGGEVTLTELVSAYSVFANDGIRNPSVAILEVRDSSGEILEEYEEKPERALDAEIARKINDMLSDNDARTPEFGANSPLYFPGYDVAAKTGTTNDYRDVWIVGYTPGISAGAWAGNNDNSEMERRVASFIIAPLWHEFMEYALPKYSSEPFLAYAPEPAFDSLPAALRGQWNASPSQGVHEILYWLDKDNPRGGAPGNPASDPQFYFWEYPVALWAQQNPFTLGGNAPASPQIPGFAIASPGEGEVLPIGTNVRVAVEYLNTMNVSRVTYYLNGNSIGVANQAPFEFSFPANFVGQATLRAVADTPVGAIEDTVVFSTQ